ncbi:MAG: MerR family transcriptional regulator [Anaerolineae bacterium]|nr:MerR family transcriptional regulator [Anaerolineae bacterium]
MARTYRIAAFAKLAGVTVRTLHHYDRMGLLTPSSSTEAGYRLYTQRDLLRLQQILTLKWMGFALKQIKALLDDPAYDLRASLAIQKAAVEAEIARLQGGVGGAGPGARNRGRDRRGNA